jgi:hypothetical protein
MQPSARFGLKSLLITVAIAASALGAGLAFAIEPNTARNVLTGWAALYAIPSLLILGRNVPIRRVTRVVGTFALLGTPAAGLFGLLSFAMSGYVGLVGGFGLAMLMIGWGALFTAALSDNKAVMPDL